MAMLIRSIPCNITLFITHFQYNQCRHFRHRFNEPEHLVVGEHVPKKFE